MSKRQQRQIADPAKPEKELASWFKSLRKHSLKLTQKELAERTGIPLGTIRYFEQTGRTSLQNFLQIATQLHALEPFLSVARSQETVSSRLQLNRTTNAAMPTQDKKFWDAHGRVGLVWSNRNASDDVLIAAALLKQPNFHLLLDIASHFGLARLKKRWEEIKTGVSQRKYPEEVQKFNRARPVVERCLETMEEAVCQQS